jgi:hypothetical protein
MMHNSGGPIFNIPIINASLSTANAWDLVGLTADSSGRLEILDIMLTIASTQFSSGSGLAITLLRGSTGTSTGAALAPKNVKGWSGAPTPAFTASGPSSGLVSTASAVAVFADSFDSHGRFRFRPGDRDERLVLILSQKLHLRTTTPSIAVVVNGTIVAAEIGKGLAN